MGKKIFSVSAVFLFVFFLCASAQAIQLFHTDSLSGAIDFSGFADNTPKTFTADFTGLDGTVNATAVDDGWYNIYAEGTVTYNNNSLVVPPSQLIYTGYLSSTGLMPGNYSFTFGSSLGTDIPFDFSISYDGSASDWVMLVLNGLGLPFVNTDGAGTLGVSGTLNSDGTSADVDFTESNLTWTGFGGVLNTLDQQGNQDGEIHVDFTLDNVTVTASPVPEPSTILLLGLGLIGMAGYGYGRKRFSKKG